MKKVQLEFFDFNNCKHTITIDEKQIELLFNEGIKIDASEILGIYYICESDFVLKPYKNKNNSLILCKVYDEEGNELEKLVKDKKEEFSNKTEQIKQFFSNSSFNSIKSLKLKAV